MLIAAIKTIIILNRILHGIEVGLSGQKLLSSFLFPFFFQLSSCFLQAFVTSFFVHKFSNIIANISEIVWLSPLSGLG